MKNYDREFKFRLDENTDSIIRKKAKEKGISISLYLRGIIMTEEKKVIDKEQLLVYKELIYEINRIGNNINQIVKNNNSKLYSENDKKELAAGMEEIKKLLVKYSPFHLNKGGGE